MTINEWATAIHICNVDHGWYDGGERNKGELIALMHSELSEALEEHRNNKPNFYIENGKPEGFAVELIDCMIRILDTLKTTGVDIEDILKTKYEYNLTRPHRHGGKAC